jgi:hypothetical protein
MNKIDIVRAQIKKHIPENKLFSTWAIRDVWDHKGWNPNTKLLSNYFYRLKKLGEITQVRNAKVEDGKSLPVIYKNAPDRLSHAKAWASKRQVEMGEELKAARAITNPPLDAQAHEEHIFEHIMEIGKLAVAIEVVMRQEEDGGQPVTAFAREIQSIISCLLTRAYARQLEKFLNSQKSD